MRKGVADRITGRHAVTISCQGPGRGASWLAWLHKAMEGHAWRRVGILALVGLFVVAVSLPRFGFIWHDHPGGDEVHTHDDLVLQHEVSAGHTHRAAHQRHHGHAHGHRHGDDHAYDHDDDHDDYDAAEDVALTAPDPHGFHAHYVDDSLPLGRWSLLLLAGFAFAMVLRPRRRSVHLSRHLAPLTARAPPVCHLAHLLLNRNIAFWCVL